MSALGEKNGLPTVVLRHAGCSAEVYLFGGTLCSYKTPNGAAEGREHIFVSPGAIYDGKKAIRGGVPLVFPQFGQPDKSMPQHGFARSSTWEVKAINDNPDCSILVLGLQESEATMAVWPFKFQLEFRVELTAVSLRMSLSAKNTGEALFSFQSLLHTYFAVPSIGDVEVRGLAGRKFVDKVDGGAEKEESEARVVLPSFTDRIYFDPSAALVPKDVVIASKGGAGGAYVVSNGASIGGAPRPVDIVVWNPYVEASPGDLPPPAFETFVCVEPGLVATAHELAPGFEATVSQSIMPIGSA